MPKLKPPERPPRRDEVRDPERTDFRYYFKLYWTALTFNLLVAFVLAMLVERPSMRLRSRLEQWLLGED